MVIVERDADLPTPAPVSRRRRIIEIAIGAIGEATLTLGVLMGLFVVWEIWWTDVTGVHRQREIVESLDWAIPVVPVLLTPETPSETPSGDVPYYAILRHDQMEFEEEPPVEPTPDRAETFATIYVPEWGEDYIRPISEGVSRRYVLDKLGIGHYPDTALPGGWGNFAIAGHRTTFGKPFAQIEELVAGDVIVVRTETTWYVYRVTETSIVKPSFSAAIAPVPGRAEAPADGRYITLTTCHPPLSARERYVVYGVLEYWALAAAGYPPELFSERSGIDDQAAGLTEGVAS